MPTPPKPIQLMTKHMSEQARKQRASEEKALTTGSPMREWPATKANPVAHAHWLRISKLYEVIDKNDAMIEPVLNRFCMLLAEEEAFEKDNARLHALGAELDEHKSEIEFPAYLNARTDVHKLIKANVDALARTRKMLLDIERESCMTLVSQLRSIPKKQEKAAPSGMGAYLQKRAEGRGI